MTNKNIRNVLLTLVALILIIVPLVQKRFQKQPDPAANQAAQVEPSPTDTQVLGEQIGKRIKTFGCVVNKKLPDSSCTPGDIFPDVTTRQICVPGYSKNVRNVPESEKNQVYAEYGITTHTTGEYEVDHLISLELGGSNDIANLWPEAAEPKPGFHEKDKVENYLHEEICNGAMTLSEAQNIISSNWQAVSLQTK